MYFAPMSMIEDVAPPAFLQLAGHPLRWRLLGELARSDRRVHELTDLVGEPQNLVSYHLGKLRDGGLVSARRSSADRRDSYYSVDLGTVRSALTAAGASVHPGLRLVPAPVADDHEVEAIARVLFLCTGNSARSQIAEALTERCSGGLVEARSAGSHPKPLHPEAVRVMREEYGVDLSGRTSKHLDVFADERFDHVVTLCDRVREVCPELPGAPECAHWSLPDPTAGHDDDLATAAAFRQTASDLEARIEFLVAALLDQTGSLT